MPIFEVELTPLQKEMKKGVDWLIVNPARAQGKSFLMCLSFLELAYKQIGFEVYLFDHYSYGGNKHYFINMIANLFDDIKENDMFRIDINERDFSIVVRYATDKEISERKELEKKK